MRYASSLRCISVGVSNFKARSRGSAAGNGLSYVLVYYNTGKGLSRSAQWQIAWLPNGFQNAYPTLSEAQVLYQRSLSICLPSEPRFTTITTTKWARLHTTWVQAVSMHTSYSHWYEWDGKKIEFGTYRFQVTLEKRLVEVLLKQQAW